MQYGQYEHVIMDSTVFGAPLSPEFSKFLAGSRVLVADTYESELQAHRAVMTPTQAAVFDQNQQILRQAVRMTVAFSPAEYARNRLHRDIWGLICLLTGSAPYRRSTGAKCLVVTADRSLIRQLILDGILVDILNCTTGEFLPHSGFGPLAGRYAPASGADEPLPAAPKAETGSLTLYITGGKAVTLRDINDNGSEACIYNECSLGGKFIGKVFKKDHLTTGKIENVRRLQQLYRDLRVNWAMLPVELLYWDDACRKPVGYLMLRAEFQDTLNLVELLKKDFLWPDECHRPFADLLRFALRLARQTLYLSAYDAWPADYNMENFGIPKDDADFLYMWDTDSFCHAGYSCKTFASDLYHDCDLPTAAMCADTLYQRVFSILTLGLPPFLHPQYTDRRIFQFANWSYSGRYRGFYIPENLRRLFYQVFICGYAPSVRCLVQELTTALEQDRLHPATLLQTDENAQWLAGESAPFYHERSRVNPILHPPCQDGGFADRSQNTGPRHEGTSFRRVMLGGAASDGPSPFREAHTIPTDDQFSSIFTDIQ